MFLAKIIKRARHDIFVKRDIEYFDEEDVEDAYNSILEMIGGLAPM